MRHAASAAPEVCVLGFKGASTRGLYSAQHMCTIIYVYIGDEIDIRN